MPVAPGSAPFPDHGPPMPARCLLALLLLAPSALAQVPPGNVLVSSSNMLREYTPDGQLVDSRPIPHPGGSHPLGEVARDVVLDGAGDLHVYNGTFSPWLSTLRADDGTWEHHTTDDWNTVNNVSYGGIASIGPWLFVSDALSGGGLWRFDSQDGFSVQLVAGGTDFIDVVTGRDGLVYGLVSNGSFVRAYDPGTLDLVRAFSVGASVRGIAVDESGAVFGASWDGRIHHFAPTGMVVESVESGTSNLMDIDLDPFGNLVVGGRFGEVILTDRSLDSLSTFIAGTNTFVAFRAGGGPGASECVAFPNSTGSAATLSAEGSNSVAAGDLVLTAGLLPTSTYIFFIGSEPALSPFGNGLLCVGDGLLRFPPSFAGDGQGRLEVFPDPGLRPGEVTRFQCWYRDPAAGGDAFNTSDAYTVLWIP